VDCVLRDDTPWPVEINPRYTASVEVLEYATGVPALDLHRRVFDPGAPPPPVTPVAPPRVVGKAVLFAREALVFPPEGPWGGLPAVHIMPEFADVPPPGQAIPRGRPVLTFFAGGESPEKCLGRLRETAASLDRRLFVR
jgi:predicted ATP-grasp superfamily ATP-dependent carboligase